MKLNRYKIGELIEVYNVKCGIHNLSPNDVSGINKDKEFFEPSNQIGSDTSNYKLVPPNYFACNLMHVGRDMVLPVAFNHSNKNKHVSPAYSVFYIKETSKVLNEYFFMFFKSPERDRFFWFHTDSSVRQGLSWKDFCDIEIEIPSIEIQRKVVNIYLNYLESQLIADQMKEKFKTLCPLLIRASLQE